MIKFTDWLRNKTVQGKTVQGSIKPAPPEYNDLEDAWSASSDSAGLSPKNRVQLLARQPAISDERLKEIERAWRS